jgi:HlyD family secretion protein
MTMLAKHTLAAVAAGLAIAGCSRSSDDGPPAMTGYAEAELVYVAPPAAGTLQQLPVQDGDAVTQGQLLFALESEPDTHKLEAARARSEQAQAQVQDLAKGSRPAELQAIDQQLAQARAALTVSASELRRNQTLVDQGFIAAVRLDELVAAHDRDAARVRELQAQRALAVQGGRSDAQAAAGAQARALQADLALAGYTAAQTRRVAPVAAVVYDTLFRVGEWVPAGAPVVALLPPGALKLRFFVPEAALAQATVGRDVALACDGCAAGLRARIRWVAPQAEFTPPVIFSNQSRGKLVFMAEAVPLNDAARTLKPGQPVDVRFVAASIP